MCRFFKDSETSGDTDFGIWGIRGLKWLGIFLKIVFRPHSGKINDFFSFLLRAHAHIDCRNQSFSLDFGASPLSLKNRIGSMNLSKNKNLRLPLKLVKTSKKLALSKIRAHNSGKIANF